MKIGEHLSAFRRVTIWGSTRLCGRPTILNFDQWSRFSSQNFRYFLFADDTNLISKNTFAGHFDIEAIRSWSAANKFIINFDKTMQILFKNHH